MFIIYKSVRYNCQVFCLNGKILMIRPKISLANDVITGNCGSFRHGHLKRSLWTSNFLLMFLWPYHRFLYLLAIGTLSF
ncbi:glutamine-dependent NAD(+) synthetase isoform X2 [Iris pallida]|uniref:Glutamine-dependent NAD(+) synthetase isoform X2 n=1 Tax=Iris pallida TaxID=29817 RepID=A0AAX6HXA7_IRIPA|nr:glutamine-dependent NAD(+) synthetase isoform X2 [Iris pallida]